MGCRSSALCVEGTWVSLPKVLLVHLTKIIRTSWRFQVHQLHPLLLLEPCSACTDGGEGGSIGLCSLFTTYVVCSKDRSKRVMRSPWRCFSMTGNVRRHTLCSCHYFGPGSETASAPGSVEKNPAFTTQAGAQEASSTTKMQELISVCTWVTRKTTLDA